MLGNLLMLVRSSASRAVRSNTRTATTGIRVLLESSVARVLLSVATAAAAAPAAECSCARVCFTTRHENTLYPPRTSYLVAFLRISVRFIICRIFVQDCRAHHAQAVRSSKTTATTRTYECSSSRLLLECRWVLLLLLLSVRVPVTTWPRRAPVLSRVRCAWAIE